MLKLNISYSFYSFVMKKIQVEMIYYTITTFGCIFMLVNASLCCISSDMENADKALKYRLNRHLPTYGKIIKKSCNSL